MQFSFYVKQDGSKASIYAISVPINVAQSGSRPCAKYILFEIFFSAQQILSGEEKRKKSDADDFLRDNSEIHQIRNTSNPIMFWINYVIL